MAEIARELVNLDTGEASGGTKETARASVTDCRVSDAPWPTCCNGA